MNKIAHLVEDSGKASQTHHNVLEDEKETVLPFHLIKAIDLCRPRAREGAEERRSRSRRSRDGTPVAPDTKANSTARPSLQSSQTAHSPVRRVFSVLSTAR